VLTRTREVGQIELTCTLRAELVLAHAVEDLHVGLACRDLAEASHRLGVLRSGSGVRATDLGLLEVHDTQLATRALLHHHVVDLGDAFPQLAASLVESANIARTSRCLLGGFPRGDGLVTGDLAHDLGFGRVVELEWWESFSHGGWSVRLTPCKHWGARTLRDNHRGYGGFLLEHQGRRIYHAGDSAYFDGFKEIGKTCQPEIALLPIGAYHPESFRHVHMGPDEAIKVFKDLKAQWLVPMHYGTFKLSFEDLDEPPRWLRELAETEGLTPNLRILEEGVPVRF
jgi:hypothetical protein